MLRLKKVTPKAVRRLQLRYDIYVIITTSEDEQLDAHGFPSKMPPEWNGVALLARYKAVGIKLVRNEAGASSGARLFLCRLVIIH